MKVAVFVPGWVGDGVMATPALRALRRHFAAAHIVAVGRPNVADVFGGGDGFDQYLPANGGPWSQGIAALAWRLGWLRVDLAVLFANSFRTALTARLGGCRRRIGYG